MPRKFGTPENYRVIVTPASPYGYHYLPKTEEQEQRWKERMRAACTTLAAAIKRHVDDVEEVDWDCDVPEMCEFCGEPWTERDPGYNGGCCEEDDAGAPASVDTHPKDGDPSGASLASGAVPKGDAQ